MPTIRNIFCRSLPLLSLIILALTCQSDLAQNPAQSGSEWYCDQILKLNLKVGTVIEVIPYRKKGNAPQMATFTNEGIKYNAENIVKFQMSSLDERLEKNEMQTFYAVRSRNSSAVKFKIGETYLFEADIFRTQMQNKSSIEYFFIRPEAFAKPIADAAAEVDLLKRSRSKSVFREVFGTDEGENISAGVISGKFVQMAKPSYPPQLKKAKVRESIKVAVLVAENGDVIKAKALCPINLSLAAAAEKAALASKFSSTVKDGKPIKIKGIIVFNFNPQ